MKTLIILCILCATLTLLACDDNKAAILRGSEVFVPTAVIDTQIFPQFLPFTPITTIACPLFPAFTTDFDLIFATSVRNNTFMDRVTLSLIDGTHVGSSITFPRSKLDGMFGSTLIVSNRAFAFRPDFGCGVALPQSIRADVVLVDGGGATRNVTAGASFR
jgi:hypothetical protein